MIIADLFNFLEATYLLPRLLGVGTYVMALLFACLALNQCRDGQRVSLVLLIYALALGLMAFFFVPDQDKDLSRILAIAHSWDGMTFQEWISGVLSHSSSPAAYLLYYFCVQSGYDGLLPAATALIFYGCCFYILTKMATEFNIAPSSISICLVFLMCSGTFLELISDIRNLLAFSIICWCVFREMVEKKSILKSIPFYFIALMLHLAAAPLVALRFVYLALFEQKPGSARLVGVLLAVIGVLACFVIAGSFLDKVFAKALSYISVKHYSYMWEYLAGALKYLLCLFVYFSYRNSFSGEVNYASGISKFGMLVWILGVCFCFEYSIFHRFMVPMMILMLPALGAVIMERRKEGDSRFEGVVLLASLAILAIVCMRGDLCGYRFLDW